MRAFTLLLTFALLPLAGTVAAQPHYDRAVHIISDTDIITSDYDLVDTTYVDRGRLDGVRVGDHFHVRFPDGKLVTDVVVTAVFERMASVKIVDSWFLKNGQIVGYNQRPMVVPFEALARREAPAELARRRHRRAGRLAVAEGPQVTASVSVGGAAAPAVQAPAAGPSISAPASKSAPGAASNPALPTPPGAAPSPGSGPSAASAVPPAPPGDSGPVAAPGAQPSAAADANQNIPPPPE